jgi:hypothetical protein
MRDAIPAFASIGARHEERCAGTGTLIAAIGHELRQIRLNPFRIPRIVEPIIVPVDLDYIRARCRGRWWARR